MAALLVVDMQHAFCSLESPLCVKDAPLCVPHVQQAVASARKHGIPVFWIVRELHPTGVDIEYMRVQMMTSGQGVTPNSKGAALVDGLVAHPDDYTLTKYRFSAFFHTHLDLMLRRLGVKQIVLCGVQTPNCVRATAVDGLALDYEVVILSDATASKSQAVQDANLEDTDHGMLGKHPRLKPGSQ